MAYTAKNEAYFVKELGKVGISLTDLQKAQFRAYYELLVEWNKVMNLTGITDYVEVNQKHFIDSLSIVKAVDFSMVTSVIDIGTGAGFPGLPLKIVFPHIHVVLLDSLNKRIRFLEEVISKLQLTQIQAVHGRAEDFIRQKGIRESFDLCVSRAVADLSVLSEYCIPYVKIGGKFIPYKSGHIDAELESSKNAVETLGGRIEQIVKFDLADTLQSRSLVLIQKEKSTPQKYPRKSGVPAKKPLS